MAYWVCKGQPWNEFDSSLVPGRKATWYTGRLPRELESGDKVFLWESSLVLRIVGLAVVTNPDRGTDKDGDRLFEMKYLTSRLGYSPKIRELRELKGLKHATFLKPGPATVLTKLSTGEGKTLFKFLKVENPKQIADDLWV